MKEQVNPELIVLAREARGITQKELAELIGINQANISRIENGMISASQEITEKIASTLDYPIEFFFDDGKVYTPQMHYYRKAKSLPTKDYARIMALGNIERIRIEKLCKAIELSTDYKRFELDEYENPETVANELRRHWKVPTGPIKNVTALMESKGIIIIPIDFGNRLISDMTVQTDKSIYIIFLNSSMPNDRKRFTLCHALGHIIMHNFTNTSLIEQEADRFASEFLMPSKEIKYQLTNLNLSRLSDLKRTWKVSMAAILMKAGQLNAITPNQKSYLWRIVSAKGYRLHEPVDISIQDEIPTILNEMIELHKKELNYTEDELAKMLYLRNEDYEKYGMEKKSVLKILHYEQKNKDEQ